MAVRDRRYKRTQRSLAEALISLTLEKGYFAVSIRDITERADVAYATFFRHYQDKDALLDEVLDVFLDDMMKVLHPWPSQDPEAAGRQIFEYVQAHAELCRVLLGSKGKTNLIQRLLNANQVMPLPGADSVIPPDVAAYHFTSSSIALIEWWLDHSTLYSPERMGQIFAALIINPSQELAK